MHNVEIASKESNITNRNLELFHKTWSKHT